MKKYIAMETQDWNVERFETRDEAESWLLEMIGDLADFSGIREDAEGGCIAEIISTVSFPVVDDVSDYPCPHGIFSFCDGGQPECPEDCEHEEPWPYSSEFEYIVSPTIVRVVKPKRRLIGPQRAARNKVFRHGKGRR